MTRFEREWQRRFERFAARHQAEHLVSGWSETGLRRRLRAFERLLDAGLLPAGARVLDLGCGAGTYVRLLAKRGHPVVGLDYSLPTLERARAADPGQAARYVGGNARRLPFRAQAFDAVLCIGVFQALEHPQATLHEMTRVLAPGGVLLVETLNPWTPLALSRRLTGRLGRRPTRLRYGAPEAVARAMRAGGLVPRPRVPILLPPRSLPGLERLLDRPWVEDTLARLPALRAVLPQAFWIIGGRP
jgi:ubiquinone/menaquinone biosynthesis C-methylase UbiE